MVEMTFDVPLKIFVDENEIKEIMKINKVDLYEAVEIYCLYHTDDCKALWVIPCYLIEKKLKKYFD
jgi:hypothetical protein